MASVNFGSVVDPKPSFETLLPLDSLLKIKPDDNQDHWNQVPESATKRSDTENYDTQQYTNLPPQNTNDGYRLSVLVPCDDPDTGQTKKCLLVKKTWMKSQRKYEYRVAMIVKNKKLASHSQIIAARKCDLPKMALCAKIRENSCDTILLHESPK